MIFKYEPFKQQVYNIGYDGLRKSNVSIILGSIIVQTNIVQAYLMRCRCKHIMKLICKIYGYQIKQMRTLYYKKI